MHRDALLIFWKLTTMIVSVTLFALYNTNARGSIIPILLKELTTWISSANSGMGIGQHLFFTEHLLQYLGVNSKSHLTERCFNLADWKVQFGKAGWCLLYSLPAQLDVSACSKSSCDWTLDQLTRIKREFNSDMRVRSTFSACFLKVILHLDPQKWDSQAKWTIITIIIMITTCSV